MSCEQSSASARDILSPTPDATTPVDDKVDAADADLEELQLQPAVPEIPIGEDKIGASTEYGVNPFVAANAAKKYASCDVFDDVIWWDAYGMKDVV